MKKAVDISISANQLLSALEQLPQNDLKKLMDTLFLKRLFNKPDFKTVSAKTRETIEKKGTGSEIVEEAVKWARKQK